MTHPLAPTTVLPALASLPTCTAAHIDDAIRALQDVYFPFPRTPSSAGWTSTAMVTGAALPMLKQSLTQAVIPKRKKTIYRVRHYDGIPDSGYASAEEVGDEEEEEEWDDGKTALEVDEELDRLRSDALERGYAIKWLTGLIKRGDAWIGSSSEEGEEEVARTACLEDASRLLARFAGDDVPEQALTRSFVFSFRPPSPSALSSVSPIMVELNDAPVDGTDHTAVGLQSWGSAIVFAERMCKDPERYLGGTSPRPRRVLELGAGTGLLSITVAQVLSRVGVRAEVRATDYHPSVLENLARNVMHQKRSAMVGVSVEKLDWCAVGEEDEGGVYDVVLAADVVYHPEHARWIRGCVERMLKPSGVFWMIIPVRTIGRHAGLSVTVEEAFPSASSKLAIVHREEVKRVDGIGRADEGGYTLFEIRWVSKNS